MGGGASKNTRKNNDDSSSDGDDDSNREGGGVDMQQLAFGDSTPAWRDQQREYDRTLKNIKKTKPVEVDWDAIEESGELPKNDLSDTIAPPKLQPSNIMSPQPCTLDSKFSKPLPTTKPKPTPPKVSPYSTKINAPNRLTSSHTTPVKRTDSRGGATHSKQMQEHSPLNHAQNASMKERNVNLRVNTSSKSDEAKSTSHIENVENILKKANKYEEYDSYDSDCHDVDEEVEGDDVYDWMTSNTNTSNCVNGVPPRAQADAKIDSSISRPPIHGKTPMSQQQRKNSDQEDEMFADFSPEPFVENYHRPSKVPKLNIPASAMSATPPQGPQRSKPPPPRGGPNNVNLKVGIPKPNTGTRSNMTPTAVRKQIIQQPSPPNSRKNSQQGKRHEVKETRDVKRNRAQMPSALKHVKPTTGDWLKKRYIVNNYIMLDVLGTGSYGEVRMCKERTTDELFAIKILSKEMLKKKKGGNTNETYFEDIKREIAIMKKLEHPNVLRLFEVLDDPNVNKLYLVLEYMKKGDLIHFIKERDKDKERTSSKQRNSSSFTPLRDQELWFIFKQVIAGVRYLHYQNIVHGDIKPQNILVNVDGTVKLADFGISKMLENGSTQKLVDAAGTPAFMSPELCAAAEAFSGQLADVWAIGATMYMLRFGAPPFVSKNIMALYNKIINDPLEFPEENLDPGLRNLFVNMLEKDPKLRYSTDQITMHPWMRIPPSVKDSRKTMYSSSSPSPSHASGNKDVKSIHFSDEYVKNEAKAMKGPLKTVGDDDIFTSIGFGTVKKQEDSEDDELLGDDIMTSDWGLDVFEKVDAEDSDSAADSDDDDESVDSPKHAQKPTIVSKLDNQSNSAFTAKPQDSSLALHNRNSMDDGEQDRRSKNFMSKLKSKPSRKSSMSSDDSIGDDEIVETTPVRGGLIKSDAAESKAMDELEQDRRAKNFMSKLKRKPTSYSSSDDDNDNEVVDSSDHHDCGQRRNNTESETSKLASLKSNKERNAMDDSEQDRRSEIFRNKLMKKPSDNLKACSSSEDDDLDEVKCEKNEGESAESMSMDDFEKMMDTLAMRPVSKSNLISSGDSTPHKVPLRPHDLEVGSEFVNAMNGVGGVHHSEQGCRKGQEDRCFLLISPGMYNNSTSKHSEFSTYIDVDKLKLSMEEKEYLHTMSIAGVFDGHSGSKCAQYLLEKFAALLLSKKGLYNKSKQKEMLMEACREMDTEVCKYLRGLNNSSGSTGVVMVYDGRTRVLTVANVGDSMCVLSRGGKAVKIHRTHRVGDEEDEVARVKKAGGTVVNKRVNGLLAISRAFGDTQFKSESDVSGPVVAIPDIVSEIITPMTEFAIAATDGLWDVIEPQAAVNFVKKKILKKQNFATIVQDLVDEALDRGSVDNVTAIIIMFHLDKKDN